MSQSTISLTFEDLYNEIADYLGYGRSPAGDRLAEVKRYANEGCARFLLGLDPRTHRAYTWSFLAPHAMITLWASVPTGGTTVSGTASGGSTNLTASAASFCASMIGHEITITDVGTFTITACTSGAEITVSGDATCSGKTFSIDADGTYTLPDDFAYLIDDFQYAASGPGRGIRPATIQDIRAMRSGGSSTGTPRWYAVQPRAFGPETGQRWEVLVHPVPGSDHTPHYRYRMIPDKMVNDADYPVGGSLHAQTVLACCLALAEERKNDGQTLHQDRARELLTASIDLDAKNKPGNLGYNGDRSLCGWDRRGTVTYS